MRIALPNNFFFWTIIIVMVSIQATGTNGQYRVLLHRTTKRIFQADVARTILVPTLCVMRAVVLSGTTCCARVFLSEILERQILQMLQKAKPGQTYMMHG